MKEKEVEKENEKEIRSKSKSKTIKISLSTFIIGVLLIILVFGGSIFIIYNYHKNVVNNLENEKNLKIENLIAA